MKKYFFGGLIILYSILAQGMNKENKNYTDIYLAWLTSNKKYIKKTLNFRKFGINNTTIHQSFENFVYNQDNYVGCTITRNYKASPLSSPEKREREQHIIFNVNDCDNFKIYSDDLKKLYIKDYSAKNCKNWSQKDIRLSIDDWILYSHSDCNLFIGQVERYASFGEWYDSCVMRYIKNSSNVATVFFKISGFQGIYPQIIKKVLFLNDGTFIVCTGDGEIHIIKPKNPVPKELYTFQNYRDFAFKYNF